MAGSPGENFVPLLSRRDKIAIWSGLIGVSVIAWAYIAWQARAMGSGIGSMDMDSMAMGPMAIDLGTSLKIQPWTATMFLLMFLMWAVMMVGMMVPSAIPMTLLYAAIARKAARQGSVLAPTVVFVSGYVLMWTLFSVGAVVAQWALDRAALLSPMMVMTSPALGALLLIVAGIYQMTPTKTACLEHCRAPAHFISQHWRKGQWGALKMGMDHGAYCLGCCWALMGLLFFGGVMNLMWIAGIALFVLLEKVLPFGAAGGKFTGCALIAIGLFLLASLS